VDGRPFPPKLCQPGRTPLRWGGALNRPCAAGAPFTERELFGNDRMVCVFPVRRCKAGADGSLEPFAAMFPRLFTAPARVREFAIICCARCCCWLNGRGVNVGLLCEKNRRLLRLAVRAIAGGTLRCKRPRLWRVGATGRRPVMKLALRSCPVAMPRWNLTSPRPNWLPRTDEIPFRMRASFSTRLIFENPFRPRKRGSSRRPKPRFLPKPRSPMPRRPKSSRSAKLMKLTCVTPKPHHGVKKSPGPQGSQPTFPNPNPKLSPSPSPQPKNDTYAGDQRGS